MRCGAQTSNQPAPGEVSNAAFRDFGPFRPETRVCEFENHELPTLLRMVFDPTAIFSQN
jgi:hypothetical protein